MSKVKIKTTVVNSIEDTKKEDYKHPSKYYYINALGNLVYIHTNNRATALKFIEEETGRKGFYTLHTSSIEKTNKEYSAVGSNTRKCFSPRLKGLK